MRRLMEDVERIELSNGMEVVVQRTQTSTIAAELEVNAGALYEEKGEEGLAHFLEHVIVPPRNHPDFAILKLLGSVIGGGSNSRMFQALSRRKGLAYRVSGGYFGGDNFGDIYVRGNFLARRTEEAIDTIFDEFERIKSEGVTEVELDAKKKGANYMIAKSFETNRSRLEMIRDVLTFGTNPEQFYREIAEASSERIVEIARKYLPSSREDNGYGILIRNPLM